MSRKGKQYKAYLNASMSGDDSLKLIPKSTLRRWRLQGKVSEDRLQHLSGSCGGGRKRLPKSSQQTVPRENPTAHRTSSDSEDVPTEGSSGRVCIPESEVESSSSRIIEMDDEMTATNNLTWIEEVDLVSDTESDSFESLASESDFLNDSGSECSDTIDNIYTNDEISENATLSSICNSKLIGSDALNQPLHPALNVSKFETLLMILHISMRHKMTDVFLEDLLNFVNEIVGDPNALPKSKHLFQKLFMFGSKPNFHFYCPNCCEYLGAEGSFPQGTVSCENCDWSSSVSSHNGGYYFLILNMRKQIQDVLRKPGLKFVSAKRPSGNVISDIMDAKDYKSAQMNGDYLSDPNALTITFNTDGAPVFKSGPNSLWPVHFYLNEIDPTQRFIAENSLLGGLWFGKSEAKLQIFLKPFIDELKELQTEGVIWKRPDGSVVESPVYAICCCTDSVAKPKVQCHMQFNGSFSCGYCVHPNNSITVLEKVNSRSGISVRDSNHDNGDYADGNGAEVFRRKKFMRFTRGKYHLRTNRELREHMKEAAEGPFAHVMGSTGKSVLCELRYFDVVHGFVIDYMHAILLGTVRRLVGYWLDSPNHNEPYYIGQAIGRLDERSKSVTLPSGMRPPRPLSDRVHWKANEWRSFLFYYGLPVLANLLPSKYCAHFKKLVNAIYLLNKASILHDEINYAHTLLQEFVWEYQDLYGEINMVYNVHITGHIAQLVAKKGPLWSYSAFPFESANGRLINLTMGTKGVATQICKKFTMTQNVPKLLRKNYHAGDNVLDFCSKIVGYGYLKNVIKGQNDETLLGRQFYYTLNDAQKQALIEKNIPRTDTVFAVNRVVAKSKLFHSRLKTKQKKHCDSCVRLESGEYALIDLVFCDPRSDQVSEKTVFFLGTKLNIATDSDPSSPISVPHIKQCSLDSYGDIHVFSATEISTKCIFYSCNDKRYVADIANFFETD